MKKETEEYHCKLDRDRRFVAPARAAKKFAEVKEFLDKQTVWGKSPVREWAKGDLRRLYFADGSFLSADPTGAIISSGGAATRAKLKHGFR
jgi:hypothetical protein